MLHLLLESIKGFSFHGMVSSNSAYKNFTLCRVRSFFVTFNLVISIISNEFKRTAMPINFFCNWLL